MIGLEAAKLQHEKNANRVMNNRKTHKRRMDLNRFGLFMFPKVTKVSSPRPSRLCGLFGALSRCPESTKR
jgi:hypothetical protein